MKQLLLLCMILLTPFSASASIYLAASMSSITQLDTTGEDDQNKDLLLNGTGFSAYLGYRFSFLAFELLHKTVNAESMKDTSSFDYSDTISGVGIRAFFFSVLNIKIGTMNHDTKGELKTGNTVILDYESKSSSSYFGLGARIPVSSLDIFGDVTFHSTKDDNVENAGVAFQDLEIGVRYYF